MKRFFLSMSLLYVLYLNVNLAKADKPYLKTDHRVDSVMRLLTLDDKIGQLVLFSSSSDVTGPIMRTNSLDGISKDLVGNVFKMHTMAYVKKLQEIAIEQSPIKVPLLFGYDVIHGHKNIFPLSLGEAASWDI